MVVVYRLSPLTFRPAGLVRVDTFAMANLVAGKPVVPELIQQDFTADAVAREALGHSSPIRPMPRARDELREVRSRLGAPGASRRVAHAVLQVAVGHNRATALRGLHPCGFAVGSR